MNASEQRRRGRLISGLRNTMESAFATEVKRNVSPGHINADIDISLQDGGGRRWPIVLELCARLASDTCG